MENKPPSTRLRSQKGEQVMGFNDDQARDYFERQRWGGQPHCCHCGSVNVYRIGGKGHRAGLFECRDCQGNFTVTVGTIMEDSHLSLSTWAKAFHLLASSKKGVSSLQLQRQLGLGSYKTAWHLSHRIRAAMSVDPLARKLAGRVEVDEVQLGKVETDASGQNRQILMAMAERAGDIRTEPIRSTGQGVIGGVVEKHVDKSALLNTDGHASYLPVGKQYAGHESVNHSAGEYARGLTHVNSVESFFSLMQRGIIGSFHHISAKHTARYADEFAFRWNGRKLRDTERRDLLVKCIEGKRLELKVLIGKDKGPRIKPASDVQASPQPPMA